MCSWQQLWYSLYMASLSIVEGENFWALSGQVPFQALVKYNVAVWGPCMLVVWKPLSLNPSHGVFGRFH